MGLLWIPVRRCTCCLAAEGGIRLRPYLGPEEGDRLRASSLGHGPSLALLFCSGNSLAELWAQAIWVGSDLDLWNLGSVFLSISAADMQALVSERLPFFSSRALKLSLLVLLFRTASLNGPTCFWEARLGAAPVGVTGGEGENGFGSDHRLNHTTKDFPLRPEI